VKRYFKDIPMPTGNAERVANILAKQFEVYKEMSIRNFEKSLELQSTIMLEESAAIAQVWEDYVDYVKEHNERT
jgi:hypothetical protein